MKNNKDGMEYEDVEQNFNYHKERTSADSVDDLGSVITMGINSLRQSGYNIIQHIRRNEMVYIVLILLTSIWISGWFANAGDAFLSLLSVVLGVVLSIGLSLINGRSR